jgi:hypothetical protein
MDSGNQDNGLERPVEPGLMMLVMLKRSES